ncbi:hypothetical protein [Saccharothrix lopnurensis]|uniref:Tetratricopeptide repeat protein n=1 Tax=Saccharothrix lopnurensis TaxID=1670621 RepID=A0ABW1P9K9_9PSEU
MPTTSLKLQRRYTRSDPRGLFPGFTGMPELEHNRLAAFWRPIVDMADSEVAPMRLRAVQPVSEWLADPVEGRWSWFAMIGVAGLRHQVLRHAGLAEYDCREPAGLPPELRTPQWSRLVESIHRFDSLTPYARALVVFQLAQLSYCQYVFTLAGLVRPQGDPVHDRYAYEVARVHARYPGHADQALGVFAELATTSSDPLLALLACAQGVGHAIRAGGQVAVAREFEGYGEAVLDRGLPDTWHGSLVRSRYHRALALLRLTERRVDDMRVALAAALRHDEELEPAHRTGTDRTVALENRRILLESLIKAAARAGDDESAERTRAYCAELHGLDPYCVEVRLVIGDGYAAIGDYGGAARWYSAAGELGTGSGAVGWFRAAQCLEHVGDRGGALNAMGRCLELDHTAVEARDYLVHARTGAA